MDEEHVNFRKLSACQGKERFETILAANAALKRIEKRSKRATYRGAHKGSGKIEAYSCPHCGGAHLGNRDAKR